MNVTLQFLGAAGTVTGSKYLVRGGGRQVLVDAGIFQGERSWREKNWHSPPFDPKEIDAVLLTHAHIDHTGILPRYYHLGLNCPVYCTKPTFELSALMLPDSGHLQEEEASYRAQRGKSRHKPPLPLYTEKDAEDCLKLFTVAPYAREVRVCDGVTAEWRHMGHILGAASIRLKIGGRAINFSGDVGRYSVPILRDPEGVELGDLLLVESTYGDRQHAASDPREELALVIQRTAKRGGVVVIPSFAVGRAQLLLYYLRELKEQRHIPDLPVFIDSPMATDATKIYFDNPKEYDEGLQALRDRGVQAFKVPRMHFIRDREESIKLNSTTDPMIIISASGMLSGGRILHHLKQRISSPLNTILFVGYQPPGGRGAWIQSGAKSLRLLGEEVAIRAEIAEISALSAHGDRDELLRWCRSCTGKPGRVAVVHGEPDQARAWRNTMDLELGWNAFVAEYLQEMEV